MKETTPVEAILYQTFPITPKGIFAAEELCAVERNNKPSEPIFERMSEHDITMYVLRPDYEKRKIPMPNGKSYTFLVRESKKDGRLIAKSQVYIGNSEDENEEKLPDDIPFESTVLYGKAINSQSTVRLNRYYGTELDSNGKEIPRDIISFEDGRYEQIGYNVHYQTHRLTPEYAKEFAEKMGIPPQTSMWQIHQVTLSYSDK